MTSFDNVQSAAAAVRELSQVPPKMALVLGSGLGGFAEQISGSEIVRIPYADLPHFPVSGVSGHSGQMVLGSIADVPCLILNGRVHYYEGYSLGEVAFPVRVAAALGIKQLVVTNAAGAINGDYTPGDLMVIIDHLNLIGDNPLRGFYDDRFGPQFVDMSETYDVEGRRILQQAARDAGLKAHKGVYAAVAGPTYETPAEVRYLRAVGADAVGMSTVPEVIVARQAGIRVAGLSVLTNWAAGIGETPLSHEEVKKVGARLGTKLTKLLTALVTHWR